MNRVLPHITNLAHYVYRFYDDADRLLYVGTTSNLKSRLSGHRSMPRWVEVARVEFSVPMHFPEAFHAEQQAILHECPAWNRGRIDTRSLDEIRRAVAIRLRVPLEPAEAAS